MKKELKTILSFFIFTSAMILLLSSGCKKNNDDNTMKDIISYSGKTNQDSTILFQTGTINGKLYLKSYSITIGYNDGGSQASHTASQDNSDGIMQINNNYFEIQIDNPGDYIKGAIISNDSINGTYSYRFEGLGETVSGIFWTER
jgi:predicted heme/steroid binding protein